MYYAYNMNQNRKNSPVFEKSDLVPIGSRYTYTLINRIPTYMDNLIIMPA